MRKATQSPKKICAVCKQPIEKHERPSITLENGEEVHFECYANGGKPPKRVN